MKLVWLILLVGGWAWAADLVVIREVTVISPDRAEPLRNAYVTLEGDRIRTISPEKPTGKAITFIDGRGRFLIPGLIDSHVHLGAVPGMGFPQTQKHPDLFQAYQRQLPRSYLYYGYTGVVDLNVAERSFINNQKKEPVTPDIFDCDGALVLANGYPSHYVPSPARFEVFRNFVYDPAQKDKIPAQYSAEEHSPEKMVQRVKENGGRCVKAHYEPGFGKEKLPTPSRELFDRIASASKAAGLPLMVHANSYLSQKFVVESDIRVIAHGMFNWGEFSKENDVPASIREVLDKVVAKDIGYQPTFQVIAGLRSLFDPHYLKEPALKKVVPPALLKWFSSKEGAWFKEELLAEYHEVPASMRKAHTRILDQVSRVVRYLESKKARLLFGSDTPSAPVYSNLPGLNGYREMAFWVQSGVPLSRLLNAATLENAKAFALEDRYGTVSEGKIANLLLLTKNPLETLEAYDSIETVILRGQVYPRKAFAAQ